MTIEVVNADQLLDKVRKLHGSAWRLVQISATRLPDQIELTYSFDREGRLTNLRLPLLLPSDGTGPRMPSISSVYACSVLYENEIHDLFDVEVQGLAVDFHGNFYRTTVKHFFANAKPPPAKPAASVAGNSVSTK